MSTKASFFIFLRNFLIVAILLVLLALLAFIGINLRDQPPSAAALSLQKAWDARPLVADADNGYIYLAGFDAATDEQPEAVGARRNQAAKEIANLSSARKQEIFRAEYNPADAFIPEIKTVFEQCVIINKTCIAAIENNKARITEWSQAENVFAQRYAQLIAHTQWRELAPVDINSPFPNFALTLKVQRLAFIQQFAASKPDEAARLSEFLDADLRFWRGVLRNTDMLTAKMVAVNAITNNFLWTNHFLLGLNPDARVAAQPNALQQPMTDEELSLRRPLIGEWILGVKTFAENKTAESKKVPGKWTYQLLFKQQDTVNRLAERYQQLIDQQKLPLAEFERTFGARKASPQQLAPAQPNNLHAGSLIYYFKNPYNPVGKMLLGIMTPAYDGYLARSADLEAFRRGLLASITLMDNAGEATEYTSPYQSKPFVINQQARSITVNGLGNAQKAQLVYFY